MMTVTVILNLGYGRLFKGELQPGQALSIQIFKNICTGGEEEEIKIDSRRVLVDLWSSIC